ncbi:TolC family protein [Pseudomonas sp. BF61]|uniref:TolC family protein n=1 Tax=Pseudomonas sp. BF61 TaxID=2741068 RepID=UPI00209AA4DA|nr:TolC family protein [Pseudomonas sp. BF61]
MARSTAASGVSALEFHGRLASRQVTASGPSERELKEIFNRAVQAAAERSPKVQRAHAELAAADADIDEAKGQRYPQVDLGTTAGSKKFGSGSENSEGTSTGINLNVVTPVYDWGRIRNTIESRGHLSKAATAAIDAELENSAFEVTNTLVELGKQRIIVDISQQYVDRMDELVKMLAGIVAVDKGRSSELTQAKARLLQAQAARDSAGTRARDAEINLRKLVGERPIMIPRTKEWNIRLANLDHLLSLTEDHPVISQAKAQTESAESQAKVVRSSSLPQLNWVISKSTAEDSLGREQPWETHLAVTWGAFRGGSTRASERAALQRAEASRQEVEQQRLDLEYRIRTANHEAKTFLERAELYRDLTGESDGIRVAFYEQWYHLGKRTLLDVLSAESDHYGNRVSEITNRFDGYQAVLRQYAGAGALAAWLRGA